MKSQGDIAYIDIIVDDSSQKKEDVCRNEVEANKCIMKSIVKSTGTLFKKEERVYLHSKERRVCSYVTS